MSKLAKQYWTDSKGEKKINCYKLAIAKKLLSKTNIKDDDEIKIYVENNKIIIEKA